MSVSEAAINKNHQPFPGNNKIRRSRKPSVMDSVSVPVVPQYPANTNLRFRILSTYLGHDPATCLAVSIIYYLLSGIKAIDSAKPVSSLGGTVVPTYSVFAY